LEDGTARVLDLYGRILTPDRPLKVIASSRHWQAYEDPDGSVASLAREIITNGERVGGTPERPLLAAPAAGAARIGPSDADYRSQRPAAAPLASSRR
jgi:hypothetical protein